MTPRAAEKCRDTSVVLSDLDLRLVGLLHQHRVMTTQQLVRAAGVPERTITYRLGRLHKARVVGRRRPYVDSGSAPLHWWLTSVGRRVITGEGYIRDRHVTPNPLFLAHTVAICELWLALMENNPSSGFELASWKRDDEGWEEWGSGTLTARIAPDATAELKLNGSTVTVFIEIDLATMSHRRLRGKVERYLRYVDDGIWHERHEWPPVLLFLTTSPERATRFLATVEKLRPQPKTRWAWDSPRPVDDLLIAACEFVRDPSASIAQAAWRTGHGAEPVALHSLLADHLAVHQQRAAENAAEEAEAERWAPIDALRSLTGADGRVAEQLGHDHVVTQAVHAQISGYGRTVDERDEWAMSHRDLVLAFAEWHTQQYRAAMSETVPIPESLLAGLQAMAEEIHAEQVTLLRKSHRAIAMNDPRVRAIGKRLDRGEIVDFSDLNGLDYPLDGDAVQADALGNYEQRRDHAMSAARHALPWHRRRGFDEGAFIRDYDAEHLVVCDLCEIRRPKEAGTGERCPACRSGELAKRRGATDM